MILFGIVGHGKWARGYLSKSTAVPAERVSSWVERGVMPQQGAMRDSVNVRSVDWENSWGQRECREWPANTGGGARLGRDNCLETIKWWVYWSLGYYNTMRKDRRWFQEGSIRKERPGCCSGGCRQLSSTQSRGPWTLRTQVLFRARVSSYSYPLSMLFIIIIT